MTFVQRTIVFVVGQVVLSMPSLGVSSLDFDRVVQTMRSFFIRGPAAGVRRVALFGGERQAGEMIVRDRHQVGDEARQIVGQRIEAGSISGTSARSCRGRD